MGNQSEAGFAVTQASRVDVSKAAIYSRRTDRPLPVVVGIGDEGESFTEIAEPPDCLERSSEQLEWELTRWPEGAEL